MSCLFFFILYDVFPNAFENHYYCVTVINDDVSHKKKKNNNNIKNIIVTSIIHLSFRSESNKLEKYFIYF